MMKNAGGLKTKDWNDGVKSFPIFTVELHPSCVLLVLMQLHPVVPCCVAIQLDKVSKQISCSKFSTVTQYLL